MDKRLGVRTALAAALTTLVGASASADGLKPPTDTAFWSLTTHNLRLNALAIETTPWRSALAAPDGLGPDLPAGGAVTGDYYFAPDADPRLPRTGFRASSALLFRPMGMSMTDVALSSRAATFGSTSRLLSGSGLAGDAASEGIATLPYLGVGYSGLWAKSGWGFWADIGVVVQGPGSALGLGRVLSGSQGADELMRELRLAPMLQLGVNYAF